MRNNNPRWLVDDETHHPTPEQREALMEWYKAKLEPLLGKAWTTCTYAKLNTSGMAQLSTAVDAAFGGEDDDVLMVRAERAVGLEVESG